MSTDIYAEPQGAGTEARHSRVVTNNALLQTLPGKTAETVIAAAIPPG